MVLTAKIFEMKEPADFGWILWKLKDFREEEMYQTGKGETIRLVTEILDIKLVEDSVTAVFSKDFIIKRYYQRNLKETAVTEEAPFWITRFRDRVFIITIAPSVARGVKKLLANYLANKLSAVIFIKSGAITEVRISHERLRQLHEANPQATKLIWFDNVDIPGVEKLCLAGSDLVDSRLYSEYLEHGTIWYVVFEVQKRGIVIGITRNFVVTLFSKRTTGEFVNFLLDAILPLTI